LTPPKKKKNVATRGDLKQGGRGLNNEDRKGKNQKNMGGGGPELVGRWTNAWCLIVAPVGATETQKKKKKKSRSQRKPSKGLTLTNRIRPVVSRIISRDKFSGP